jgi:hypothetical protein
VITLVGSLLAMRALSTYFDPYGEQRKQARRAALHCTRCLRLSALGSACAAPVVWQCFMPAADSSPSGSA